MRLRILLILSGFVAALACTIPVSAHANLVRAEPGISASVTTAPTDLRLYFSETPEPRYSEVSVLNAERQRFDKGDLHPAPGDNGSLIVGLRDMPQGVYTVIWKTTSAVDGHTTGGSFAFVVGTATLTPGDATVSSVTFSAPKPAEVATKWLGYLATSVVIGTLGLWMLVWLPALSRSGQPLRAAIYRRLMRVIAAALVVLIIAAIAGALVQVTKSTGKTLAGALDPAILSDFLFRTRTGSLWCVRLLLALVLTALFAPEIARVARLPERFDANRNVMLAFVGIVLGANQLLAISLISHAAASAFHTPLTVAMDWVHLLATTVWIGGLVALIATLPLLLARGNEERATLRRAVARFSNLALVSVGMLTLTGLYSAWLHVGSLGALRTTDYGRALLIKLILVSGLVALGAFNLLWVRPRLAAGSPDHTPRHLRRSVAIEVALGAAVLLVVAVLTGSAPSREVAQATKSPLAQRAKAGDLTVTLTPSTLQPGDITDDVLVTKGSPVRNADRVTLRFASRDLGIAETEAIATARGDGHYTLSGPYTALAGTWQTRVIVRRTGKDDVSASFDLPIGSSSPITTTAASAPRVTATTVGYGVAALVIVIALLGTATTLSRRWSPPRHAARQPTPLLLQSAY
ncbi:MAG: copper resistance CopC/CopD family protein [Thermomicrobiales bacterium]